MLPRVLVPFAAALLTAGLAAQDLLGVTWNGATVLIDSHTAGVTPLGMGLFGQNALGRTGDGQYWSTQRVSTTYYQYTRIDPTTGSASYASYGSDIRDFATAPGNRLYGIRNGTVNPYEDWLVLVDPATGVTTSIGSTGYTDIQGLVVHLGVLYAWDVFAGLLVVDPATGAAVDPFPNVSGPAYQQSLCSHPDGRLLLGGGDSNGPDQLFSLDVGTGVATLIGTMPAIYDIRGIEPLGGFAVPFGQPCQGTYGPTYLGVTGALHGGGQLQSVSINHAANTVGAVILGLDTTTYGGAPLPRLLDPLVGTNNCSLFVAIDASLFVVTGPTGPATLQYGFSLPAWTTGVTFHLQHACFEPVAGNSSWSNGVTVNVQ
ncbi:MAG: hypothetical protein H6838_02370 [Planctomycetes bacterium]|nr:hypothetical protein [Planctomycetota bacterium]MCB9884305.1 hypothetical protein [Planctomycetota bacterium]